jgi:nucleoside-diphosphate-sugar epimerase
MNVLITGADQPLGKMLCRSLADRHSVKPLDRAGCDHREPDRVSAPCQGMDAIIHSDVFDAPDQPDALSLDWAARGTYVLMQAARDAGVGRVILASRLSLFDTYPGHYVIDETWKPQPLPHPDSLAPYLAELTCREFARQGGICSLALRLDRPGGPGYPVESDVVTAFEGALALSFEPNGYRWRVYHLSKSDRFPDTLAGRELCVTAEER